MLIKKIILACLVLVIGLPYYTKAQTVFENTNAPIYGYLQRMAQKGVIEFNDLIQPVSRIKIQNALVTIESNKNSLTEVEKKELAFYKEEYPSPTPRYTSLRIIDKDFELHIDPLVGANRIQGKDIAVNQVSNGIQLWGQSKHWGFQMYYRDWTETGKGLQSLDSINSFTEAPARILVGLPTEKSHNYSELSANISYSWDKGSISFGKMPTSWGYGEASNIVLSTKAPSFPSIRFDYEPNNWLAFNYQHAWLNSNVIDSVRSYTTNSDGVSGNQRIIFVPKFMAMHSITIRPVKGFDIALGESIIYSDQVDPGFLIPVNIFKVYDNNRSNYVINAGSNGQIFMQLNSRNQIKNTHLYGSLFIDEIRISEVFNKAKARNQLGFTLGGSITDVFIPYLTTGIEYTRINPFVYQNLLPAQNYTQYGTVLGDWMGNNADRICLYAKYNPIAKLQLYARYQQIRKGNAGSVADQYLAEPQPQFLASGYNNLSNLYLQAKYEWIHNLYLQGSMLYTNKNTVVQFGLSLGLR